MKNLLVSILGAKLKLVSKHSERSQRCHSNRIDRDLHKERSNHWIGRTYLVLELPGFERSQLLDQLRQNFPQTFGLISKFWPNRPSRQFGLIGKFQYA